MPSPRSHPGTASCPGGSRLGNRAAAGGSRPGCQAPARSEPLKPAADAATPAVAEVVEVVAAVRTTWPRIVHLQGSLLGDEHVVVGAKVAGRTHQVAVDLGTRVEQGAVLATLETEEFDLAVQEARAQLEQVRVKLGLKPGEDEDRLDRRRVPAVVEEESLRNQAKATLHRAQAMAPRGSSRRRSWSSGRPSGKWPKPAIARP